MISKPLFKQSCKANAGIWTFVTTVTCFMLAMIILVLGNLSASSIRTSMTDMFVSDAIEASLEKQSMTYYSMTEKALGSYQENYDKLKDLFQNTLAPTRSSLIAGYDACITSGMSDSQAREYLCTGADEQTKVAINTLIDYYLVMGNNFEDSDISKYVLNNVADGIYTQFKSLHDEETANNAKLFIGSAINSYTSQTDKNTIDFATNYIPTVISNVFIDNSFDYEDDTIYIKDYFSKEELHDKSYTSIITYRAQMDIKKDEIISSHPEYSEAEISRELSSISDELIVSMSKSLVDELPEKVFDALSEIRGLDVYGLVVGSIFFRIAGLLLPMIFVIMTANNLIAGQVDSGSMAYVLSTPTKRRTVVLTQILYLISSLFAMFALTTITSVVCLAIVSSSEITITYSQILLLNLGAFITMLAVSGICFMSSCLFNRCKLSMSCGGGLTMFFLVATILGLFGSKVIPSAIRIDAMKYFNYVSIISLFDAISILGNTTAFIWKFAILIGIAIVTYVVGLLNFEKKDLPL